MTNEGDEFELPAYPECCPRCGFKVPVRLAGLTYREGAPKGVLYFKCRDCAEIWTLRLVKRMPD